MKRHGCSIIFINDQEQILLLLRDNNPSISYPNMWDIPGGHVEEGETPKECIAREMKEEMDIVLNDFFEFKTIDFSDRMEHVFWKKENLDISKIKLTEGQYLKWFTKEEVKSTDLAYGFNKVVMEFFKLHLT